MTRITLTVTGAKAQAAVTGPLTSGMAGLPVKIEYDDSWTGLTKNLVCRCSRWGSDTVETRTILNIGETSFVAHEVMKADMYLYLGIEGYSAEGQPVIPTTWASCGKIQPGANSGTDLSTNKTLPVWAQLQTEINQLKTKVITEDQIAAAVEDYLEENPVKIPDSSPSGNGLTGAQVAALDGMFKVCAFIKDDVSAEYTAFKTAFGIEDSGDTHTHSYTSSVTTAANCTTAGVRTYTCSCGNSYTESIPATGHSYVDGVCTVCGAADPNYTPDVTLSSISAVYSGGEVAVGTAVADLTGIVVTAHYSDGTSETVTGYTLSGTVAEGENTVTVTYGGKTATFTVTGVADSGGEENTVYVPELVWEDGYRISSANGDVVEADTYSVCQLIDISDYTTLHVTTTSSNWFAAGVFVGTNETPNTVLQNGTGYWGGNYMTDETFDISEYSYLRMESKTEKADTFTVELS